MASLTQSLESSAQIENKDPYTLSTTNSYYEERKIFEDFESWLKNKEYDKIENIFEKDEYLVNCQDPFSGGTFLHFAAGIQNWDIKVVLLLLGKDGPRTNRIDKIGRTPLHWAVAGGCYCVSCNERAARMVTILLKDYKTSEVVNIQDANGDTCLHLAARNLFSAAASIMIDKGADINLKNYQQRGTKNTLASTIIDNIPSVLEVLLDKAVESDHDAINGVSQIYKHPHQTQFQTQFLRIDLGVLLSKPKLPAGQMRPALKDEERFLEPETIFLKQILNARSEVRSSLLTHPVVNAFLYKKWESASKWLIYTRTLHFIISCVYTHFVFVYYLQNCPYRYDPDSENANKTINILNWRITLERHQQVSQAFRDNSSSLADNAINAEEDDNKCTPWSNSYNLAWFILIYTICAPASAMLQKIMAHKLEFFKAIISYLWIIFIVLMITTSLYPIRNIYPPNWMYSLAAITVWLSWTMILAQYAMIPNVAIYIEMFGQVLKTILLCVFVYGFLVVGFAFGFHAFFPADKSFESPTLSFVKVITLMLGETDYDNIFEGTPKDDWTFNIPAHLFYSGFLILVTIVLVNLLIGLSVSDIQHLKEVARSSKLERQIKTLYELELQIYNPNNPVLKYLFSRKWRNGLIDYFTLVKPVADRSQNTWYLQFQPHNPKSKTLPKTMQFKLLNLYKATFCRDMSLHMQTKNFQESPLKL